VFVADPKSGVKDTRKIEAQAPTATQPDYVLKTRQYPHQQPKADCAAWGQDETNPVRFRLAPIKGHGKQSARVGLRLNIQTTFTKHTPLADNDAPS
jgi:hypothetical protein